MQRWGKELEQDYPREPMFEDRFFNVPSSNLLYWDANIELPCRLIRKRFWEKNGNILKKRIDSALVTTQTRNTSNSSFIKKYLFYQTCFAFVSSRSVSFLQAFYENHNWFDQLVITNLINFENNIALFQENNGIGGIQTDEQNRY